MVAGAVTLRVGTYDQLGGNGVCHVEWTPEAGLSIVGKSARARNASYGVQSTGGVLYLVNEKPHGAVGAYCADGLELHALGEIATGGADPCYVSLDRTGLWLAAANYGSGSVSLFALNPADGLPDLPAVQEHHGSGPVSDRQERSHAHCAIFSPDNCRLLVVDLGADQIWAHPFDATQGLVGSPTSAFRTTPGAGPRHLVFPPDRDFALLLNELGATLSILLWRDGRFVEHRTFETAPPGFTGSNLGGHLASNRAGDRIYVTNRGHDSIAVFAVDHAGDVTLLQHMPSGGASPRHFALLENAGLLVLANEQSSTLTHFRVEHDGTLLRLPGHLAVPGAVFVAD